MKTMQTVLFAALVALCAPGAGAAPGPVLAGPVAAVAVVPAISQWSLGLVADGRRSGDDGVLVLAVSPDGAAERMGVREGDRLLAINGWSLAGVQGANAVFERALAEGGGEVRLEVQRDGSPLVLQGRAEEAQGVGCGYVSTVGVPPRVSRNIFEAEITQINGESTPLQPLNRYQLPAGRHVLVVRESIDRYRISRGDNQRIHRMQRRLSARAYKVLVVDVEPNTRYSVGAELLSERMTPDDIRANEWWQPVVWEARPEACR